MSWTKRAVSVVAFAVVVAACAGQAKHEKTLKTTLVSLNAARDGFVTWDRLHQEQIIKDAPSLAEGKSALATYREARQPVSLVFEVAYRGLAVAALDPSDLNVMRVLEQVKEVVETIRVLTGLSPNDLPRGP